MNKPDRTIRLATADDQKQWDTIVNHPLQSWAWGEFRKSMGVDVVRIVQTENNKINSAWQLTFHRIPHTPFTVGYFPKGPTPSKGMIDELVLVGKKKRAIFIQLEPNVINNSAFSVWHSAFLKPSHHPLFTKYTFVLDLTKSEDALLSAMHSKTRYNIKVAVRHDVSIKEDNSDEAFQQYLSLTEETTKRQGFYAHTELYHTRMWEILRAHNMAHLFTAKYQHMTLAAWILFVWKDTLYYPYGASSREHRETMAPTLMLWEIIRWAKKKGLKYFDLWGALGPEPDEHDPWYGFHRFKEGFRPEPVEFVGSYDLVIHSPLYVMFMLADSLRWWYLRNLRR